MRFMSKIAIKTSTFCTFNLVYIWSIVSFILILPILNCDGKSQKTCGDESKQRDGEKNKGRKSWRQEGLPITDIGACHNVKIGAKTTCDKV